MDSDLRKHVGESRRERDKGEFSVWDIATSGTLMALLPLQRRFVSSSIDCRGRRKEKLSCALSVSFSLVLFEIHSHYYDCLFHSLTSSIVDAALPRLHQNRLPASPLVTSLKKPSKTSRPPLAEPVSSLPFFSLLLKQI